MMKYGAIKSVGNGQVDVQVDGSAGVVRNVRISSQVNWNTLAVGNRVLIDDVNGKPIVLHTVLDVPQTYTTDDRVYSSGEASTITNALLADGSVPLVGNLPVSPGVTVDGYDISLLGQTIDNLQAADSVARTGYTVMTHASHVVDSVAAADVTVKIRHNLFVDKELITVSNTNGEIENMKVVGEPIATVDNRGVPCYLYTVTRRISTSPANLVTGWAAATLVNGLTLNGYIAFDARHNRPATPSMRFVLHTDVDTNATEHIVRVGSLNGSLNYTSEDYGFAVGRLTTGDKFLAYSYATNGFRIRGADFSGEDETGTEAFRIWGIAEGGRVPGDSRFGPASGGHQEWTSESQRLSIFNGANEVIYFSPTESRFKNMVWAGSEAGPQIGIGELDGQGIIVARNALDVAQFVVRTQQDGVYVFAGNPKPQANWMEFDGGFFTVDGTIRARALEIIGQAVVGDDTSEIIIRDPADPRRYGHIKPHYMAGYSVDSTDTQYLSTLIAWAPATLEAVPGSGVWHTWVAGESFQGDWRYNHWRVERNGRVGLFNGETPKAWMDTVGNFHATGEVTATAGSIGGWTIEEGHLFSHYYGYSAGMRPADFPFYAGADNPASAPFRVTDAGALTAGNAHITGWISASEGLIGGWIIGATALTSTNGTVALNAAGSVTWASGKGVANEIGIAHVEDMSNYWSVKPDDYVFLEVRSNKIGHHVSILGAGTTGYGVEGLSSGADGTGVYGIATDPAGVGIVAQNAGAGDALHAIGITKLGDGGLTDYAQFAANGTLSMHGMAAITGYLPTTGAVAGATLQAQTFTNGVKADSLLLDAAIGDIKLSRSGSPNSGALLFRPATATTRSQFVISPNGYPTYSRARMLLYLTDVNDYATIGAECLTLAARADTSEYWISTEAVSTGTARDIVFKRYQQSGLSPTTIDLMRLKAATGYVGFGTNTPASLLHVNLDNAVTNYTEVVATFTHNSTGTPVTGLGASIALNLESSTTPDQNAALLTASWTTATHATRTSKLVLATTANGGTVENLTLGPAVILRPSTDGSGALTFANAAGTPIVAVDTTTGSWVFNASSGIVLPQTTSKLTVGDSSLFSEYDAAWGATYGNVTFQPTTGDKDLVFRFKPQGTADSGVLEFFNDKYGSTYSRVIFKSFSDHFRVQQQSTIAGDAMPIRFLTRGGATWLHLANDGMVGVGTATPTTQLDVVLSNATTNVVETVVAVSHTSSNTPIKGFGADIAFKLKSSTTVGRAAARIATQWDVATDGSRAADLILYASDYGAEREGLRIHTTGSAVALGFFGSVAATKQTLAVYSAYEQSAAYEAANIEKDNLAKLDNLNQLREAYENLRAMVEDLRTKVQTTTLVA